MIKRFFGHQHTPHTTHDKRHTHTHSTLKNAYTHILNMCLKTTKIECSRAECCIQGEVLISFYANLAICRSTKCSIHSHVFLVLYSFCMLFFCGEERPLSRVFCVIYFALLRHKFNSDCRHINMQRVKEQRVLLKRFSTLQGETFLVDSQRGQKVWIIYHCVELLSRPCT